MRSYDQFCGLAYALDLVGDRWTLLVVRELLVAPRRHRELVDALPGVASNLLAERLRGLEQAGLVERDATEGRKSVVYSLTARGQDLREPVLALVRWGSVAMTAGPRTQDAVRPQWVGLALEAFLTGHRSPRQGTVVLRVREDQREDVVVHLDPQGTRVEVVAVETDQPADRTDPIDSADHADHADRAVAALEAPPAVVLGLVTAALPLAAALTLARHVDDSHGLLPLLAGAGRPGDT